MTAIVGLEHRGDVWMGGDSAGVSTDYARIIQRRDAKVFRNGPFLIGFTTSFRMGRLLRYELKTPAHPSRLGVERYMATLFIDAVRACLKGGGYASKEREAEFGGAFLVGYRGKLFTVRDDYDVGLSVDPFAAVGCGDQTARGALFATAHVSDPAQRIRTALLAAEHCCPGVRRPFTVMCLPAAAGKGGK